MIIPFKQFSDKADITLDYLFNIASGLNEAANNVLDEDDLFVVDSIREALIEAMKTPSKIVSKAGAPKPAIKTTTKTVGKPIQKVDTKAAPTSIKPGTAPATTPNVVDKQKEAAADAKGLVSLQKRMDTMHDKWQAFTQTARETFGADVKPIDRSAMEPGRFYHFKYASKYYDLDKIDFFERNPLIVCISRTNKIILGLNFHYLAPYERRQILDKFNAQYGNTWQQNRKMPFDWEKAKEFFPGKAKRMIKAYIPTRIKECYTVDRKAMYFFSGTNVANFTPEVTASQVQKNPKDIRGNKFAVRMPDKKSDQQTEKPGA